MLRRLRRRCVDCDHCRRGCGGLLWEWLVVAEAVGGEDVVGEGAEEVFASVVQHGSLVEPGVWSLFCLFSIQQLVCSPWLFFS